MAPDEKQTGQGTDWAPPLLDSRRVALRRIRRDDYPFVVDLETAPDTAFRWRYGARTASDEEVISSISRGAMVQFLIWRRAPSEPIGLTSLYNVDTLHGFGYLGLIAKPRTLGQGLAVEGALLMLRYAFAHFNLRKIYAEVQEGNLTQFRSGVGRLWTEEGRLRSHLYYNDRYWDLHTLAVTREHFYASRDAFDRFLKGAT